MMVVVVIVATLLWAAPEVVPDVAGRWRACRDASNRHASEAAWWMRRATSTRAQYAEEMADKHLRLSWKYRRSLLIPWDFYVYGDRIRSGQLRQP
jgi:hypothetical protein